MSPLNLIEGAPPIRPFPSNLAVEPATRRLRADLPTEAIASPYDPLALDSSVSEFRNRYALQSPSSKILGDATNNLMEGWPEYAILFRTGDPNRAPIRPVPRPTFESISPSDVFVRGVLGFIDM